MILRRVIAHFRKQEWTAIAIDFVIVVVGVFIGMQVSNWNAARADRAIAARHLTEIAEDLRSHLALHDVLYGSALARIAAVDYVYDKAFSRKLPRELTLSVEVYTAPEVTPLPADRLDNLMGAINLVRIKVGSRSGYESLISSGHLGLIENKDLARSMQLYYGSYDNFLDTGNAIFRAFRTDGAAIYQARGVSVFDERPADEIVALARDNPDFAAYLRTVREWAILHANLLEDLRPETEALLAAINAELAP
jgi:hypothetical protein